MSGIEFSSAASPVVADQILKLAGQGTFGTVFHVFDAKHQTRLALKVVRAVERYTEAAKVEIQILEQIRQQDVNHER